MNNYILLVITVLFFTITYEALVGYKAEIEKDYNNFYIAFLFLLLAGIGYVFLKIH